jgi:hypothetical protein
VLRNLGLAKQGCSKGNYQGNQKNLRGTSLHRKAKAKPDSRIYRVGAEARGAAIPGSGEENSRELKKVYLNFEVNFIADQERI